MEDSSGMVVNIDGSAMEVNMVNVGEITIYTGNEECSLIQAEIDKFDQ